MKLAEALEASHAQPAAAKRIEILHAQLDQMRAGFFEQITNLQRNAALDEAFGEDATRTAEREAAEKTLGNLHVAIEATLAELRKLEPDA